MKSAAKSLAFVLFGFAGWPAPGYGQLPSWLGGPSITAGQSPSVDSGHILEALIRGGSPMRQSVGYDNDNVLYQWCIADAGQNCLVGVGSVSSQYPDLIRADTALLLLRSVVRGVDQRKEGLSQEIAAQKILIEQQNQDLQATKLNLTNAVTAIEELRSKIHAMECKSAIQPDAACADFEK